MKYTISLYGKGNELTIGSVKKETWDYIQEEFGGDEKEYLKALDNGDVPEEHMLASESWNMCECDDLWHHEGCWSSCYRVEVEDEDGNVVLADEMLTPDSSRFWPLEGYQPGQGQPSFDKQFVRDWLKANPDSDYNLPDEVLDKTVSKYKEAFLMLTGKEFDK